MAPTSGIVSPAALSWTMMSPPPEHPISLQIAATRAARAGFPVLIVKSTSPAALKANRLDFTVILSSSDLPGYFYGAFSSPIEAIETDRNHERGGERAKFNPVGGRRLSISRLKRVSPSPFVRFRTAARHQRRANTELPRCGLHLLQRGFTIQ